MVQLKGYQERAIESLEAYFKLVHEEKSARVAYSKITQRNFNLSLPYRELDYLKGLPSVCIKIPTGGGKTLVGCHSIATANEHFLKADHSLVLWLVPSNPILTQTIEAFNNKAHTYRKALEEKLGNVNILSIEDALRVNKATLNSATNIIVSTIQTFRIEDPLSRRVYQDSGDLMDHFVNLPNEIEDKLEKDEEGNYKYSLANLIKSRRPIVIVDEAHNNRTNLSFETLTRLDPSCIIEFTATPDTNENPSNVIYSASANELKSEKMIKIPLRLETQSDWQSLLGKAISKRVELEEAAKNEKRYLRPIMLIQAQNKGFNNELTVDFLEDKLINDFKIPKESIAIHAYSRNDLESIDILSNNCKIKYIITVKSLKEGWDCPFAYVLCSFAELSSSVAIEQILGRIIRMPNAKKLENDILNQSYAFVLSSNFFEAAATLRTGLVNNGFNKFEAKNYVNPAQDESEQLLLPFDSEGDLDPNVKLEISKEGFNKPLKSKPDMSKLDKKYFRYVKYDEENNTLSIIDKNINEDDIEEIIGIFEDEQDKIELKESLRIVKKITPSERGIEFKVPALAFVQEDLLEYFEETHFLNRKWDLNKYDATLSEQEFLTDKKSGMIGEIDITKEGTVTERTLDDLQQTLSYYGLDTKWTEAELILWLDRTIKTPDIPYTQKNPYLTKIILYLVNLRGLSLDKLAVEKYRLKESLITKINQIRGQARNDSYQQTLFEDDLLTVVPEISHSFGSDKYEYTMAYPNEPYEFKKHYYPIVGDLIGKGEEFECAQYIDNLTEVEFWVRNIARRPSTSFWLQTSTDKFYPDFVCKLKDGRFIVIEYKGADRWSDDDSKEKRILGELWESKSNGSCLFIMPKAKEYDSIAAKIRTK